jgi:hypothetical protein
MTYLEQGEWARIAEDRKGAPDVAVRRLAGGMLDLMEQLARMEKLLTAALDQEKFNARRDALREARANVRELAEEKNDKGFPKHVITVQERHRLEMEVACYLMGGEGECRGH